MPLRIIFKKQNTSINFATCDRLLLGEGLFETIKIADGEALYADLHWQRLKLSANFLGIAFELSLRDWLDNLSFYIKAEKIKDGGIKAVLSGGKSASRGLGAKGLTPYLFLETFNYSPDYSPIMLTKTPWLRDSNNPIYKIKSVNYLEAIMAYRYAQEKGANDALFFNLNNEALETTIANIFLIINNQLITPPLSCNILPGITRSRILMLCQRLKQPCFEQRVTMGMLAKADALFTCNTLQNLRPVKAFDEVTYNESHPLLNELRLLLGDVSEIS